MTPTPMDELSLSPTDAIVLALVTRMMEHTTRFNEQVTSLPIPSMPVVLSDRRREWFNTALAEEVKEFNTACEQGDPLEAADGILDLVFFALGRLCEMGIPTSAIWEGIVRANMAKQQGMLAKRPGSLGHDAIKPPGWTPPDHSWLMAFTLADVEKARLYDGVSPVLQEVTALRIKKGLDYNAGPQLEDYFPFGHQSYAQMLHVKNLRIQGLLAAMAQGRAPNFEGLRDTLKDLINYACFYVEALDAGDGNLASQWVAI